MTYERAHLAVRKIHGPAKTHACRHCTLQAAHWAYDHEDPCEVRDANGKVYSNNPERYRPLCSRCHARFDSTKKPLIERAMVDTGWPLDDLVAARRPDTSWRLTAFEITTRTGIDISGEALRLWYS